VNVIVKMRANKIPRKEIGSQQKRKKRKRRRK
jgi:hypothetical protein